MTVQKLFKQFTLKTKWPPFSNGVCYHRAKQGAFRPLGSIGHSKTAAIQLRGLWSIRLGSKLQCIRTVALKIIGWNCAPYLHSNILKANGLGWDTYSHIATRSICLLKGPSQWRWEKFRTQLEDLRPSECWVSTGIEFYYENEMKLGWHKNLMELEIRERAEIVTKWRLELGGIVLDWNCNKRN